MALPNLSLLSLWFAFFASLFVNEPLSVSVYCCPLSFLSGLRLTGMPTYFADRVLFPASPFPFPSFSISLANRLTLSLITLFSQNQSHYNSLYWRYWLFSFIHPSHSHAALPAWVPFFQKYLNPLVAIRPSIYTKSEHFMNKTSFYIELLKVIK